MLTRSAQQVVTANEQAIHPSSREEPVGRVQLKGDLLTLAVPPGTPTTYGAL